MIISAGCGGGDGGGGGGGGGGWFCDPDVGSNKIGSDLRVTSDASNSFYSSLSWTGSEFGVSWHDYRDGNREIYFARFSAAGTKIGSDLRVTSDASQSFYTSLSWTGSEFGVSWMEDRDGNWEIYFARVSADGAKIGSDLRVTSASGSSRYPSLSWTGSEFGVSWEDYRDGDEEIYFARVSADGAKIGSDLRVTSVAGCSNESSLIWTGAEFGVSWEDCRDGNYEVYFARVSAAGTKIGSDLRVSSPGNSSTDPSLSWTGSEFGVSWIDGQDMNYEIYFARLSATGAIFGFYTPVTIDENSSLYPSLFWAGSEFGVSWMDDRDVNDEIYFARLSADGFQIGSDLRVTSDASESQRPSLSWTGSEFGLSWHDDRDGNPEIYFARIRPCP
jgi:hypothetical protein